MSQARKYTYRLLKSSWGIRISILARSDTIESLNGRTFPPQERDRITFEGASQKLPEEYKEFVIQGLLSAFSDIEFDPNEQPFGVVIQEIKYAECDFQPEGLAVAMRRWAEEEFGLPRKNIEESFDRAKNKYTFDWA